MPKPKAPKRQPKTRQEHAPPVTAEDRRRMFVEAYLKEPNATKAAIAAGYSEKTARAAGSRMLTDVNVRKDISKGRRASELRTGITADWVRLRLAQLADTNLDDVADWGTALVCCAHGVGNPECQCEGLMGRSWFRLKDLSEIPEDQRAAIASIKVKRKFQDNPEDPEGPPIEIEETEVKMVDKVKPLEVLAKHLGMLESKIAVRLEAPVDLSKLSMEERIAFERLLDAATPDD